MKLASLIFIILSLGACKVASYKAVGVVEGAGENSESDDQKIKNDDDKEDQKNQNCKPTELFEVLALAAGKGCGDDALPNNKKDDSDNKKDGDGDNNGNIKTDVTDYDGDQASPPQEGSNDVDGDTTVKPNQEDSDGDLADGDSPPDHDGDATSNHDNDDFGVDSNKEEDNDDPNQNNPHQSRK